MLEWCLTVTRAKGFALLLGGRYTNHLLSQAVSCEPFAKVERGAALGPLVLAVASRECIKPIDVKR